MKTLLLNFLCFYGFYRKEFDGLEFICGYLTMLCSIILLFVKIAGHTGGQSSTRQATSVMASKVVAEVKSINQATRVVGSAALADRQCRDQATQRASTSDQSSTEV